MPRSPVVGTIGTRSAGERDVRNGKQVVLESREVTEQEVQVQFTYREQTQAARRLPCKLARGISHTSAIPRYPLSARRPHGGRDLQAIGKRG